ncbi:MAG: hypothetical protein ACKOVH_04625 [Actinomycetota bacterium]
MSADAANPEGYFEVRAIADLNDRILAHLRSRWDAPPELAPGWERDPAMDPWVQRARIARKEGLPAEGWLLKDPRVTLLLPLWRRVVLDRCVAVLVVRDPTAVAWSVTLRDGLPTTTGLALWATYNRAALEGLTGLPVYVCDYDRLVADPAKNMAELVSALVSWGEASPSSDVLARATDAVRPHLNRSTWRRDVPEVSLRPEEVEAVAEQLGSLAGRHDVFTPSPPLSVPWQQALLTERRVWMAEVRDLKAQSDAMQRQLSRLERTLGDSQAAFTAEKNARKEAEGALRWTRSRLARLEHHRSIRLLRALRRLG